MANGKIVSFIREKLSGAEMLKKSTSILAAIALLLLPACGLSKTFPFFKVGPSSEVRVGEGFLQKTLLYKSRKFDKINSLLYGDLASNPGYELALGGDGGVEILDANMKVISTNTEWDDSFVFELVDIDDDGEFEYMGYRGFGWVIYGHDGRELWTTRRIEHYIEAMTFGQLDGDDELEFVLVDLNDWGRNITHMWVLDHEGEVKASTTITANMADDARVAISDINSDGVNEIIMFNGSGRIFVFDPELESLENLAPQFERPSFSASPIIPFPTKDGDPHYLFYSKESYIVASLKGTTIASFQVPLLANVRVTHVRLQANKEPYFVIFGLVIIPVEEIHGLEDLKMEFYVFNSNGQLVYDEVNDEIAGAMTTMPSDRPGEEALLIGGNGRIYSYTYNHEALEKGL